MSSSTIGSSASSRMFISTPLQDGRWCSEHRPEGPQEALSASLTPSGRCSLQLQLLSGVRVVRRLVAVRAGRVVAALELGLQQRLARALALGPDADLHVVAALLVQGE